MKESNLIFLKQFIDNGMLSDEIPFFINDLKRYFARKKNVSLPDLNIDLENLGWGIQVIDRTLFKTLLHHFENVK